MPPGLGIIPGKWQAGVLYYTEGIMKSNHGPHRKMGKSWKNIGNKLILLQVCPFPLSESVRGY
jgi:hypothetical protein